MAVAGVKTGDVILSINHMPVKSSKHLRLVRSFHRVNMCRCTLFVKERRAS